ncbi:hypothetical protein IW262DRAFT_881343 [Armillaria fumosa]|nr:hypothetical protein IW262DRAFT_881343 [Armillaria fumosa]
MGCNMWSHTDPSARRCFVTAVSRMNFQVANFVEVQNSNLIKVWHVNHSQKDIHDSMTLDKCVDTMVAQEDALNSFENCVGFLSSALPFIAFTDAQNVWLLSYIHSESKPGTPSGRGSEEVLAFEVHFAGNNRFCQLTTTRSHGRKHAIRGDFGYFRTIFPSCRLSHATVYQALSGARLPRFQLSSMRRIFWHVRRLDIVRLSLFVLQETSALRQG